MSPVPLDEIDPGLIELLRGAADRWGALGVASAAAQLVEGVELVRLPPADDTKRIPIAEFRRLGFVQEINRRLLHPCGLALEAYGDEGVDERLVGVWDYRDDPEGIYFADGVIDPEHAARVDGLLDRHRDARQEKLGYVVQPVPEP